MKCLASLGLQEVKNPPHERPTGERSLFPSSLLGHDPGGTRMPLPKGVSAVAIYGGPDDCYRYLLEWTWDSSAPTLMVGLMNPSCATHLCGDRTLWWLYRWAALRGIGRLLVVNADGYRAAIQARLAEVADPMGPDNAHHILLANEKADMVVLGYGQPKVPAVRTHGPRMARLIAQTGRELHVWGLSKNGTPKHPLYQPAITEVTVWRPSL